MGQVSSWNFTTGVPISGHITHSDGSTMGRHREDRGNGEQRGIIRLHQV